MKNLDIARISDDMADLLKIQGENSFDRRAYRNVRSNLEGLTDTAADIAMSGALKEIPCIGKDLGEKIVEYIEKKKVQVATLPDYDS